MTFNTNGYGNSPTFTDYPQNGDMFDAATAEWLNIKYQNQTQFNNDVIRALSRIGASFSAVGARLSQEESMIGGNAANIKSATDSIGTLNVAVKQLQDKVNAVYNDNNTFKSAVNSLLDDWRKQLGDMGDRISSVNTLALNNAGRILKIEQNVDPEAINAALNSVKQLLETWKDQKADILLKAGTWSNDAYNKAAAYTDQQIAVNKGQSNTAIMTANKALDAAINSGQVLNQHISNAATQHQMMMTTMDTNIQGEKDRATTEEKKLKEAICAEESRAKAMENAVNGRASLNQQNIEALQGKHGADVQALYTKIDERYGDAKAYTDKAIADFPTQIAEANGNSQKAQNVAADAFARATNAMTITDENSEAIKRAQAKWLDDYNDLLGRINSNVNDIQELQGRPIAYTGRWNIRHFEADDKFSEVMSDNSVIKRDEYNLNMTAGENNLVFDSGDGWKVINKGETAFFPKATSATIQLGNGEFVYYTYGSLTRRV